MSQIDSHIRLIQEKLAGEGSEFSYEEVEEVFKVLRDASLKLIITNMPRAVFTNETARNAFEDHFKSYDPHSTFFYLSSFSRAQVYMERPEAALCARLQSQGWKLPRDVVTKLAEETVDDAVSEGISCFIDHVDEEDASPNWSEEDADDLECNCDCGIEPVPLGDENQLASSNEDPSTRHELCIDEIIEKMKPKDSSEDSLSNKPLLHSQHLSSAQKSGSAPPKDSPLDYRMSVTECESTSEASGDDLGTLATTTETRSSHRPSCPKYRESSKNGRRMKHLAPPKPPRLFLLSPPASPPVGWQPKPEAEPVINYELLEALASLAPGEAFELYPRDAAGRHPSIVITPCETHHSTANRPQIVHTPCPERKTF